MHLALAPSRKQSADLLQRRGEADHQLVDAVRGELRRERDHLAGREFRIGAVDRRLIRLPARPER